MSIDLTSFLLAKMVVFLLGIGLLVYLLVMVGSVFGKKPTTILATAVAAVALMTGLFFVRSARFDGAEHGGAATPQRVRDEDQARSGNTQADVTEDDAPAPSVADHPAGKPASAAEIASYLALISDQPVFSDRARPAWADQSPGLSGGVYRWPVKSGLYSTQEECRQALAAAIAEAVTGYGKIYLASDRTLDVAQLPPDWFARSVWSATVSESYRYKDPKGGNFSTTGSNLLAQERQRVKQISEQKTAQTGGWLPSEASGSGSTPPKELPGFPEVTATGRTNLIEQPLYAETVETSVGPMQQLCALVEFGDYPRAQLRDALRQVAVPRRLRWAASGLGAAVAIVGVVLTALKIDLASDGKHRRRLHWLTALGILLVVGGAWSLCLL